MELDELDIYDDLEAFHEEESKKSKELLEWETKYNGALKSIEQMRVENKGLAKKIKRIEVNFQCLLDTAKAEIKRKDTLITQLRKEKDDVCFRRRRMPPKAEDAVGHNVVGFRDTFAAIEPEGQQLYGRHQLAGEDSRSAPSLGGMNNQEQAAGDGTKQHEPGHRRLHEELPHNPFGAKNRHNQIDGALPGVESLSRHSRLDKERSQSKWHEKRRDTVPSKFHGTDPPTEREPAATSRLKESEREHTRREERGAPSRKEPRESLLRGKSADRRKNRDSIDDELHSRDARREHGRVNSLERRDRDGNRREVAGSSRSHETHSQDRRRRRSHSKERDSRKDRQKTGSSTEKLAKPPRESNGHRREKDDSRGQKHEIRANSKEKSKAHERTTLKSDSKAIKKKKESPEKRKKSVDENSNFAPVQNPTDAIKIKSTIPITNAITESVQPSTVPTKHLEGVTGDGGGNKDTHVPQPSNEALSQNGSDEFNEFKEREHLRSDSEGDWDDTLHLIATDEEDEDTVPFADFTKTARTPINSSPPSIASIEKRSDLLHNERPIKESVTDLDAISLESFSSDEDDADALAGGGNFWDIVCGDGGGDDRPLVETAEMATTACDVLNESHSSAESGEIQDEDEESKEANVNRIDSMADPSNELERFTSFEDNILFKDNGLLEDKSCKSLEEKSPKESDQLFTTPTNEQEQISGQQIPAAGQDDQPREHFAEEKDYSEKGEFLSNDVVPTENVRQIAKEVSQSMIGVNALKDNMNEGALLDVKSQLEPEEAPEEVLVLNNENHLGNSTTTEPLTQAHSTKADVLNKGDDHHVEHVPENHLSEMAKVVPSTKVDPQDQNEAQLIKANWTGKAVQLAKQSPAVEEKVIEQKQPNEAKSNDVIDQRKRSASIDELLKGDETAAESGPDKSATAVERRETEEPEEISGFGGTERTLLNGDGIEKAAESKIDNIADLPEFDRLDHGETGKSSVEENAFQPPLGISLVPKSTGKRRRPTITCRLVPNNRKENGEPDDDFHNSAVKKPKLSEEELLEKLFVTAANDSPLIATPMKLCEERKERSLARVVDKEGSPVHWCRRSRKSEELRRILNMDDEGDHDDDGPIGSLANASNDTPMDIECAAAHFPAANISHDEKFNEIDSRMHSMFQSPKRPLSSPITGEVLANSTVISPGGLAATNDTDMTVEETLPTAMPNSSESLIRQPASDRVAMPQDRNHEVSLSDVSLDVTPQHNNSATNDTVSQSSANAPAETTTKCLSMGTSHYRFVKVNENEIKLIITRKRNKKKTKPLAGSETAPASLPPPPSTPTSAS